jgi:hypothetical protein
MSKTICPSVQDHMSKTKRTFVGAVVAATAAFTILGVGPAQAAAGTDHNPVAPAAAQVDDSRAPDRTAAATAVESPAARSALATIQTRIARYVATHGTTYTFGNYLDPATGRIVLDTDAPADLVSSLTDLSGAPIDQRQAASQLQLRRTTITDTSGRLDDSPPFHGSAGLDAEGFLCSSGFAVQNSSGTRFMTTAGHCYSNGATVLTESDARTVGTVVDRHLPTVTGEAMDVELIGGQSYAGRVFTGGVASTTSAPVRGAGSAVVGFANYCHSGRTTGEQCGHRVLDINGESCTETGCVSPVIVYTGGIITQGGDSGGAFYAKDSSGGIHIRGEAIASNSARNEGFVEPWTVEASALGLRIVTG